MAPTDHEFNQLKQRVADLEAKNIGQRLANLRVDVDRGRADITAIMADLDNANAAFASLWAQVAALDQRLDALEALPPTLAAA